MNKSTLFLFYLVCFPNLLISVPPSDAFFLWKRASIIGSVKDYWGAPLEGVRIKVPNTRYEAITDTSGKYSIEYAPGSFYGAQINAPTFAAIN